MRFDRKAHSKPNDEIIDRNLLVSIAKNVCKNSTVIFCIFQLHLQYNNLSYIDRNITGQWKDFLDLDIGGNSWACDCKNQWLIDELYPSYVKINKENAVSTR